MSRRVLSRASAPRAQIDTAAPASAQASAIARPMPRLPPQMTARFPDKSMFMAAAPHLMQSERSCVERAARASRLPLALLRKSAPQPWRTPPPPCSAWSPSPAAQGRIKTGQAEGIAVALRLRRGPLSFAAMSLQSEPGPRGSPRGHGGRPSRQESAQLSDRILDVATALFLSDGFGATSIEGIAKRAGISKRTFYHRFTGKEMLFEAVVRRLIERWTPSFDTALLEGADLADGLRQAAEHMLKVALTPEALALHRMVITEARRFPKLAHVLYELGAAAGVERIARHPE